MFRRKKRGYFKRRRPRVAWQTAAEQRSEATLVFGPDPETEYFMLQFADNDFVSNHPRFAKSNDVGRLLRVVGKIRIGLYRQNYVPNITDYEVQYGLCIIKGDYNPDGSWSQKDQPDPGEPGDEDDKWLYKNTVWLSTGGTYTRFNANICNDDAGTGPLLTSTEGACVGTADSMAALTWALRPGMVSTDQDLPNGSYVDVKSKRRLQYGERLELVTKVIGEADENLSVFCNWQVRVLMTRPR